MDAQAQGRFRGALVVAHPGGPAPAVASAARGRNPHALVRLAGAAFCGALPVGGMRDLCPRRRIVVCRPKRHRALDVLAHRENDAAGGPTAVYRPDLLVLRLVSFGPG